jgi:Leucine-rich repeat (LRR) protein
MESAAEPRLIDVFLKFGDVKSLDKDTKTALRLCNKHLQNSIDFFMTSAAVNANDAEALLRSRWNLKELRIVGRPSRFSRASLESTFSGVIDRWPRLEVLYLRQRGIFKALPENLGSLVHLKRFQIDVGMPALPSSFGHLSSLERLWLSVPALLALEGLGPLKQLIALTYLQMNGNVVSKPGFLEWICGNLSTSFEDLDLFPGVLALPSTISNFVHLTRLRLHGNLIEEVPESIGALSMLKTLDLPPTYRWDPASHRLPLSFTNLTMLEELDISPEVDNAERLEHFSGLTKLKLGIWDDEVPDFIWNFKKLKELGLTSKDVVSTSLSDSLGELQSLNKLTLACFELLETIPNIIGTLSCLEHLEINHCPELRELPEAIKSLPSLSYICIRDCYALQTLPEFGTNCQLTTLVLQRCHMMTRLPDSIGNLRRLQHLVVWGCNTFTELPTSIGALKNLQSLDVTECDEFTTIPESFALLVPRWYGSCLDSVSFYGCKKLKFSPRIEAAVERLKLQGCYREQDPDDDDEDEESEGEEEGEGDDGDEEENAE